jgi:hypothetical protein
MFRQSAFNQPLVHAGGMKMNTGKVVNMEGMFYYNA